MPGNPKGSTWRSTPRAKRNRKELSVTLSDEERVELEAIAKDAGEAPLSRVVAAAIAVLGAAAPATRRRAVAEAVASASRRK